jgi:hypothetical protein
MARITQVSWSRTRFGEPGTRGLGGRKSSPLGERPIFGSVPGRDVGLLSSRALYSAYSQAARS